MQPSTPLTKKEFNDKYWFSPMQLVTVVNPKAEDYRFMVELRHFIIKAGATESFPGTVANVYLSHMTRILAQDDERMEYLSDPNLMKQYYDQLIVDVEDLARQDTSVPAYLQHVPQHTIEQPKETPPWQSKTEAPVMPPTEKVEVKEDVKEFEQGGNKYKMTTDKNGKKMYYMDGKLTSEANYAKAASML